MKNFKKIDVYNSHCYFIQYNSDYFRIILQKYQRSKGFEEITDTFDDIEKFMCGSSKDKDEINRVSLSRTKRNIKEIALCNEFQYFATLTINSSVCDRYNLELSQENLKKVLKALKRKIKDFKYIFITEKHKDNAFHFHGLITEIPFYINQNGYFSNSDFDKLGFNSFSKIKDYNKCCNYITKYITKDCIRNSHNQIYISSRGLKKADKYEIPLVDIDWSFENDFVKIKDFSSSELSHHDIFHIMSLYNLNDLEN